MSVGFDAGRLAEKLDLILTARLDLGDEDREALADALAHAAVAELSEQRRLFLAQRIDPSAWDRRAIYSPESRGAAKSRALRAADNVLEVIP